MKKPLHQSIIGERLRLAYLLGGIATYRPGEKLGPRTLTDYECVLVLEGSARHSVQAGGMHDVPAGGILLTRPGFVETYQWDTKRPTRHAYFHFDILQLPDDWPSPERWSVTFPSPPPLAQTLYREIVERIHTHPDWPAAAPDTGTTRLVESLFSLLLCPHPAGRGVLEKPLPEPVMRAIHLMRLMLDEAEPRPLRLAAMARSAGVTPKHLCALFTANIGHPPHRTFRLLQLHLALSLLARSELSIKEIARRCHFQDPYYFSRYFAGVYQISPTQMRQRLRAGGVVPRGPLPPALAPRLFW